MLQLTELWVMWLEAKAVAASTMSLGIALRNEGSVWGVLGVGSVRCEREPGWYRLPWNETREAQRAAVKNLERC